MIAFPGTGNWPIRLAQDKGYFAQTGLEVTLTPTPNSVFQITKFAQGDFDIAMTAIDNVIAYMEGQGEVPLPQLPDFVVFMGGSPSIPSLATVPEVTDYLALKGKTLAVDATTTGYALPSNLAPALYENFVGPRGVAPKAQIDMAGVRKVLELRNEYGNPTKPLTDPTRYYDPQYYEAAMR